MDILLNSAEYKEVKRQLDYIDHKRIDNHRDALEAISLILDLEKAMDALKPLMEDPEVQANSNPHHVLQLIVEAKRVTKQLVQRLPGFNEKTHGEALNKFDDAGYNYNFESEQIYDGQPTEIKEDISFKKSKLKIKE